MSAFWFHYNARCARLLRRGVLLLACVSALAPALPAQRQASPSTPAPAVAKPAASSAKPSRARTVKPKPASLPTVVRPVDPATALPLLRVNVEGAKRFQASQVASLAGLTIGSPVNRDAFAAAHQQLVNSGVFETVAYRFEKPATENGYAVTFEVTETELFYPIRLEDIPLPMEEVQAFLRQQDPSFDGNVPATAPGMQRYAGYIAQMLARQGNPIAIRGLVWAEQGGALSVMFRPDTPIPSISDVRFQGSAVIEPLELRRIVIQTATGILFTEDRLRTVLNNEVLPAFWAIGRLGVRFTKVEAVPLEEEKGVRVMVTVEDGPLYTLRAARVLAREYREQDLLAIGRFPVGEEALWTKVASGVKAIQTRLQRDGYLDAKVTWEPKLEEAQGQVDLTVVLEEGPQYLFRALKVEGLDLVTEQELRKLWSLTPGKPFNALYPDYFLQQIRELGLMDNLGETKATVERNERSHDATVTLVFKAEDRSPKPRVPLVRPQ
ncbi:MAG: hypothetical protein MUF01_01895 [Bryobacterales bacterium]|jgi:outer membrane protein assembly factor BamA|nr:hypothetical protein [Bryobacterales bacterium]